MEEMGLREKNTQNIMCKLMINKHNICVGLPERYQCHWPKFSGWSNDKECVVEGQQTRWKRGALSHSSACPSIRWCHESFYFML